MSAVAKQPSLYQLLAVYWARYENLARAMTAADLTAGDSDERALAENRQNAAGDLLNQMTIEICSFIPTWRVDADIKANFVPGLASRSGGTLTQEETDALISSLSIVWAPRKQP